MVALLIISCANTYWFFSRRKKYQLLNVAKKTAPADPATGSSSAAPSKPFSAFTKPYNTAPVDSRNISTVHIPRPQQQQQPQQPRTQQQKKQKLLSAALQLSVWDYSPIARDIFCLFSPVQVFQQMLVGTMKTADDWNVTPYFAFLVAYSIPAALFFLVRMFEDKVNDREIILRETTFEQMIFDNRVSGARRAAEHQYVQELQRQLAEYKQQIQTMKNEARRRATDADLNDTEEEASEYDDDFDEESEGPTTPTTSNTPSSMATPASVKSTNSRGTVGSTRSEPPKAKPSPPNIFQAARFRRKTTNSLEDT
eukprot:GEZU01025374.1.p1 GENE.GEZU01025374.1~~GEZU01025374.1.p1  ORF type:complete len:311 (+),score=88.67 GEZU01025374.1:56-988(+)